MNDAVTDYIDAIPPEHRPLFDRVHRVILEARPDATILFAYKMPTYQVGGHRLHVGVWKHGVSIYGWQQAAAGDFVSRHPDLVTGKGTIQLRTGTAATIPDAELLELVRTALDG